MNKSNKRMILKSRLLYPVLFSNKYTCSYILINEARKDENHHIWGACKDFGYEILKKDINWVWLAKRIDDFALLSTHYMMSRLSIWLWKAYFELGSLHKALNSIKDTVIWLMSRWVSTLKNLFDIRYSYHVPPSFLISFNENYTLGKM